MRCVDILVFPQVLAQGIYDELQGLMDLFGQESISNLMPLVVNILENLDSAMSDNQVGGAFTFNPFDLPGSELPKPFNPLDLPGLVLPKPFNPFDLPVSVLPKPFNPFDLPGWVLPKPFNPFHSFLAIAILYLLPIHCDPHPSLFFLIGSLSP